MTGQGIDNRQTLPPTIHMGEKEEPHLLIIWHSRTGASEQMAKAAAGSDTTTRLIRARDVTTRDILDAGGYLFVCPENLAALSGEMKEMFDANYYPVLGRIEGRPYASIIAAGSDGENAQRQLDRIATGWRLKRIAEPWIVNFSAQTEEQIMAPKQVEESNLEQSAEMALSLVEGLKLGVF